MPIAQASRLTMGTPFFCELKKQASFFLKDKIRTARLALTDVTPAQLLTEEATDGNPWAPDARTMRLISRAAFEVDDYWRIVGVLHNRLVIFDRSHWREPYQALVLLEHLLTHGPESVAEEFQIDREVIQEIGNFQHIDERGFNWGLTVRKKSERVLTLLEKGPLLKEERDRARKISRGIQGFGSFNQRWTPTDGVETERHYGRSNSNYEDSYSKDAALENQTWNSASDAGIHVQKMKNTVTEELSIKGNNNETDTDGESMIILKESLQPEESRALLACHEAPKIEFDEEHPFGNLEHQRMESKLLLSST